MNRYAFMRKELTDTYGILELQNKILEIALYLDKFCREHNITYYLMGGSALGAVRHGGLSHGMMTWTCLWILQIIKNS